MHGALWAIRYAVDRSVDDYLAWFHQVHIPEKLARPGYAWAAHYESASEAGHYLALFGSASLHTFLAPSPGQLKTRQDPLTRQMTGLRRAPWSGVLLEAMATEAPATAPRTAGPVVRFAQADLADSAAEDDFCAWAASERLPRLAEARGFLWGALLVAAIGRPRHALLEHYVSAELVQPCPRTGAAFVGRRIWPRAEA